MKIPLIDLKRQYESIKKEIDAAVMKCLADCAFVGGPEKEAFENEFAAYCGAKHALGVANGTDSLMICLKARGIGPGDEVIVPANSFIATSEMVSAVGAKPVFVDVDEKTFNIDLDLVEKLLETRAHTSGGKIRAIMPVHLYGRIVDMTRVMALAEKYQLFCLEDSAQAHGAKWQGRTAGSIGHAGSFSFYPGKNLGAYGDAGALTTNDPELATLMKKLANHGRVGKYDHDMEGFNSRLDGIQAAILRVKLKHLPAWTEARKDKAHYYQKALAGTPKLQLPDLPPRDEHVFHMYVVRVPQRDKVLAELKARGIEGSIHYPVALPLLKAYASYGHKAADFPVSAKLQNEIMSLPLFPEMTQAEQEFIVKNLREILQAI